MNKFQEIEHITNLFKLKPTENGYEGLLYPTGQPWSYGRACLKLEFKLQVHPDGECEFLGSIVSIDDSGLTIWGPKESKELALERLEKFKTFIESWQYACPSPDVVEYECQKMGLFPEYW